MLTPGRTVEGAVGLPVPAAIWENDAEQGFGWFSKAKGLCWQEVEEAERFGVVEGLFKVCYRKKTRPELMFKN